MRTNGNLAIKPGYKPAYNPTPAEVKRKSAPQAHKQPKNDAKNLNVAVAIFYMILICAIAFCLISREVSLYEKSSEISRLENRLEQAESQAKQAQVAAEKVVNLKNVEDTAISKFAMSRPEKSQTVYINIEQNDYVEKTAQKNIGMELQQGIESSIRNLFGIFGIN